MAFPAIAGIVGSIVSAVVGAFATSSEEKARRQTIKEQRQNLKVEHENQKLKLLESEKVFLSTLARENLTGNWARVAIHASIIIIGGSFYPLAIYDGFIAGDFNGTEIASFILNSIHSRIPEAYTYGYLSIVGALFGTNLWQKRQII